MFYFAGIGDGISDQLNALFLFPHQKLFDEREREEWQSKFIKKVLPSTIASLLPGLHYAILESSKLQKDRALYPGPLVEQYFRKYAVLQTKKGNTSERELEKSKQSAIFNSRSDGHFKKCSPVAFSCLQLYISSPVNFSVPVVKMSNILAENAISSSNTDQPGKTLGTLIKLDSPASVPKLSVRAESKAGGSKLQGKRAVHEEKELRSKRSTKRKSVKKKEKKSKSKSVPRAALTITETVENQASNKRRRLVSEDTKQIRSSREATVKLASAPYSQRRKRGAEVLTAALVQDEKRQVTEKMASTKTNEERKNLTKKPKAIKRKPRKVLPPEEQVPDRPRKRKEPDQGKKVVSVAVTEKSENLRKANERNGERIGKAVKNSPETIKTVTVEQMSTFSKPSENAVPISEDSMMEKRISMYESHALNLLADLALNSFGTTSIPYIKTGNMTSANESMIGEAASTGDHVSTVDLPPMDSSLPAPSTTEPDHIVESEGDKPKIGSNVSARNIVSHKRIENIEKQLSPKAHFAAAKAKARYNALSKICLEHSYSQLPLEDISGKSAKQAIEQPIPSVPDSTTSFDVVPESSTNGIPGGVLLLTSENKCPDANHKPRAVSKLQDNLVITLNWQPKYDFDLDSKFTKDPLEKTINRALHGPWNYHLKEKVEDVKIILHMWIALFYSRSNQQINCSSRKVVEHSNPAKYVSINTVLDPFELEITDTDDITSAENNNIILPVGKKSKLSCQVNPLTSVLSCKSRKSKSKDTLDLTVPTKDYNIKLSSEIYQMCKDSESAFYNDSLQTSMTCKMAPTSKGAQTPANVMKAVVNTNVPTVCYIGDTNLFITELTDKSENYMDIGGFSSEKAKFKEIEHKYSRNFSRKYETLKSAGQIDCSDVNERGREENVSSAEPSSETHSDSINLNIVKTAIGGSHETTSNLERHSSSETNNVHDPENVIVSDLNKDVTNGNMVSGILPIKNKETLDDLVEDEALYSQSTSDVRMPTAVDNPQTATEPTESQDLLKASIPTSKECNDNHDARSPDVTLHHAEDYDNQLAIAKSFSAMTIESPSDHDANTGACLEKSSNLVDPLNEEELKDNEHVDKGNLPFAENLDVQSKSIKSKDVIQVDGNTDNITSHLKSSKLQLVGLEFCNSPDVLKRIQSDLTVDNSSCTKEGELDWTGKDSFITEHGQEKFSENIHVESGNLVEPTNIQKLNDSVLNESPVLDTKLSNCSGEVFEADCAVESSTTDTIHTGKPESINKSLIESSERTEGKEEPSTGEALVEHTIPIIYMDKDHNAQETDVYEAGHISEVSMVDKADKVVPENPFLTSIISQYRPSNDDVVFLDADATDKGRKECSDHNVNLSSDSKEGSLPEASEKEIPSTLEKPATNEAVECQDGASLIHKPSSAGANSSELDGVAITSVCKEIDIEGISKRDTMEITVQCENNEICVHEEQVAESQNRQPTSQTPFKGEEGKNKTGSVETANEEVQTDVNNTASSELNSATQEGISVLNDSSEKTLQSDITSSFCDQLMSKYQEMDSEQERIEKLQKDCTKDVYLCPTITPAKTGTKELPQSSKSSSSQKREFLSKLKRICLGSTTGHQVASSCENVPSPDNNGSCTKVTDVDIIALTHDEEQSTLEKCNVVEKPAKDKTPPEESVIIIVNPDEPENLEEVMSPQDNGLITPWLEDVSDGIEQDPSPAPPDLCFIVNTGSISKEQYDRWSETSDEDIEYIPPHKEPLPLPEQFSKEIQKPQSLSLDKPKCSQEQTTEHRTKNCQSRQSGPKSGLSVADENVSRSLPDLENNSVKSHSNVFITRNFKGTGRVMRTINKESSSKSDLAHLFSDRRMVSDDLTQNTLDMENVRFMCKLKEILQKSSTEKHIYDAPFQPMFEARRIPSCSHSTTKCSSPLLITMHCPPHTTDLRGQNSWHPSTYSSSQFYEDEIWDRPVTHSRAMRKCRSLRYSPFHFSRLRYENTLDKSSNDISVILNEYVQSNHLKLSSVGLGSSSVDRTSASQLQEDSGWQTRRTYVPVSCKSHSVKNIISDVCVNLHSKLQNVARASEQKVYFYIHNMDDGNFISSTKSLLVKNGHIPTDPQDFLKSDLSDSHQLLIIIKNEDVFSCINKIPYLLQLKLLPNVTFAGVDTPEDMTESAYEEIFQAGGFVASDKGLLESMTLGKLKEVLTILEKMNRTSHWKWLIHYRENRKIKEDKRAEALSGTKMSLLKSSQQSNLVEILPYHQCDSRSKEPSDDLSCLLNLQYQHIHSRLAVYLTGATSLVTEKYEQNGFLVYDVDTFVRKIQKVDSQFQTSWY
ncbi:hypothetical protein GDO81_009994 [Engystomops pustulosus]|uniref:Protein FAM208B n=2 Tax=Engystomops pustulosus TaxID=76066 RepID=A0AAV7BW65_ENGPU|nr:hypothetical protein GDO81_009994 [Engystomops pustulosus]